MTGLEALENIIEENRKYTLHSLKIAEYTKIKCYICKKEGDFNVHKQDEFAIFHLCNTCLQEIKKK